MKIFFLILMFFSLISCSVDEIVEEDSKSKIYEKQKYIESSSLSRYEIDPEKIKPPRGG
ncbi:hypothetical protein [Flavobacterium columnare]|uniref:hypothetical protein n=1 Tax=Flavobacterium columnare TaxID=996 RepID=UPI0013053EC8|nr:hypothetical protein [Flavobacterium columnare]